MAEHICPPWIAYLMLTPLRRLFENPKKLFGAYVASGMTVLEPGPAMGFFTLPLARMVGEQGRVVAVDVQPRMLKALERRALRARLRDRIDPRLVQDGVMPLDDLAGQVGFCPLMHVVHEVDDPAQFFTQIRAALAPAGKVLLIEPKGHVTADAFAVSLGVAAAAGLRVVEKNGNNRAVLACE